MTVVKREGEFEAIVDIEHEFCDATLVAPFNCVDMIDDHRYNEGDVINIEKYGVRVLKKS